MNCAIETDIFKEAATFSNTENQTPNKETNQITPLSTSPWPASLYITFGTASMPSHSCFIPKYTGAEKAKGQISVSVFNYFVSERDQKSTLINTVLSMDITLFLH